MTGIFGVIKAIMTFVWLLFLVDQLGRRKLLLIGAITGSICMWVIGAYICVAKPTENPSDHLTGGGIAANLARVLPQGAWVEVDRATWSPPAVFRVLTELAGDSLESTEGTWNLGLGMLAVVAAEHASAVTATLTAHGLPSWKVGAVSMAARDFTGFEQGAKGVDGGAVRLVGTYAD